LNYPNALPTPTKFVVTTMVRGRLEKRFLRSHSSRDLPMHAMSGCTGPELVICALCGKYTSRTRLMPERHTDARSPVQALGKQEQQQDQSQQHTAATLHDIACNVPGHISSLHGLLELLPCDDPVVIGINGVEKPLLTLWQLRWRHLIQCLRSLISCCHGHWLICLWRGSK